MSISLAYHAILELEVTAINLHQPAFCLIQQSSRIIAKTSVEPTRRGSALAVPGLEDGNTLLEQLDERFEALFVRRDSIKRNADWFSVWVRLHLLLVGILDRRIQEYHVYSGKKRHPADVDC